MNISDAQSRLSGRHLCTTMISAMTLGGWADPASASERGNSQYPLGVDSIATAVIPSPDHAVLLSYNKLFEGDIFVDDSRLKDSHVEAVVSAYRVVYTWPVSWDDGKFTISPARPSPALEMFGFTCRRRPKSASKSSAGFIDPAVFPIAVSYRNSPLAISLSTAIFLPIGPYERNNPINTGLGAHHFTYAPTAYVTYRLAKNISVDLTSATEFNATNRATCYKPGNSQSITLGLSYSNKRLQIGHAAYYSTQFTDDRSFDEPVPGGKRSRVLGLGARGFLAIGHGGISLAYFRDTQVRNRAGGDNFWLKFGVPL